ncbi:MAG: Asp23/Gls24 family envelope stress response protein [Anaerolineae bacterium]|nr:Asp23/Gls24 family envelope stress response protein [Anaerolineae bacterium]
MSDNTNPLGNIYISNRAIASIASQCALQSYGVVGLAAKNLVEGITSSLVKDPLLGIDVQHIENMIGVELYIIIEYGTRISEVASSVADSVHYQLERSLGISVKYVNVHVRGLRISNPD